MWQQVCQSMGFGGNNCRATPRSTCSSLPVASIFDSETMGLLQISGLQLMLDTPPAYHPAGRRYFSTSRSRGPAGCYLCPRATSGEGHSQVLGTADKLALSSVEAQRCHKALQCLVEVLRQVRCVHDVALCRQAAASCNSH
ncbi:hypothetical protein ABBQ32_011290 [Trebouxia sp. C0010 RCD-2024]